MNLFYSSWWKKCLPIQTMPLKSVNRLVQMQNVCCKVECKYRKCPVKTRANDTSGRFFLRDINLRVWYLLAAEEDNGRTKQCSQSKGGNCSKMSRIGSSGMNNFQRRYNWCWKWMYNFSEVRLWKTYTSRMVNTFHVLSSTISRLLLCKRNVRLSSPKRRN